MTQPENRTNHKTQFAWSTACLLLLWASATPAAEPPKSQPSVVQMLAHIAATADPDRYPFLNRERAAKFRAQLEQLTDPQQGPPLAFALAKELLFAGETAQAIDLFEQIRELIHQPGARPDPFIVERLNRFIAIAYLRLGEQENCIANHGPGACILPIAEPFQHRLRRGSERAIQELMQLIEKDPQLDLIWLLNLAWMTLGGYPDQVPEQLRIPPAVFASEYPLPRFPDIAANLGLDLLTAAGGAILEDFDQDGFLDLMASAWGLSDPLRTFHNNGDGTFSEWTAKAGLTGQLGGLNLNQTDFNNDGFADVLVLRGAWLGKAGEIPNSLLKNNGDGTFKDVTIEAGLLSLHPTQAGAWADFDQDGWLDLFIGNESKEDYRAPCELYHNRGDGTFEEIAAAVGLNVVGFVKGAAWGDFNNDGRPDLYLSRHKETNLLFRNEGPQAGGTAATAWRFTEVGAAAGVTEPLQSFPTWFWDYDNDGWEDLFVASGSGLTLESLPIVAADYLGRPNPGETPRLFHNRGDGTFADVTRETRLNKVLLAMGSNFGDLDNDGFLDAYLGTGEPSLATLVPNRMFRNADGKVFQDVTTAGGFGHLQKGHGVAFGDLDNDGDEDIYAVIGGAFSGDVYQNVLFHNPGSPHAWVNLQLRGTRSNRLAIGARIKVLVATPTGERAIFRTVGSGGSFGASSLQQEIGLGDATSIVRVEVTWPGQEQRVDTYTALALRSFYRLREGDPQPQRLERTRIEWPTAPAGHHHP